MTTNSEKRTRSSSPPKDHTFASGCETWPLAKLIRHIVERHHTWLRAQLPEIAQLIRQTIASERHARSGGFLEIEKLFRRFQREMENHLKKEEAVLFPLIENLEARATSGLSPERQSFGPLRNPVQFMIEDHELADRLLTKMKELARESEPTQETAAAKQSVLERLEAVEEDLATHVHLEDDILFARAVRLEEGPEPPAL